MKHLARLSCLLTILFLWSMEGAAGQTTAKDSLRRQISKETNDTVRIKLLIKLGLTTPVSDSELDKCLKEAFERSKKIQFRYGLVFGRYYEGRLLSSTGNYNAALEKVKSCIEGLDSLKIIQPTEYPLNTIRFIFNLAGRQAEKFQYYSRKAAYYKRNGPIENLADCYHGIAGYYYFLGDYDKTIEYYLRAREVYKSFDPFGYATDGAGIGNTYLLWGNLEKAEEYLASGLNEFLQIDDINTIVFCYNILGDLYVKRHDYKRALQYYFQEKKYWFKLSSQFIAINMVSIAAVHLQMNDLDSAYIYLRMADKLRQSEKLPMLSSHGPLELDYYNYKYFAATGNHDIALKCLEAALREAQLYKHFPLVLKYTKELHAYLLKKGDSLQSMRYLMQYQTIQDSLNAMNAQERIAAYEIEQHELSQENEIEQLQIQKSTQRNYYLIGGAFLLLMVAAGLSRLRYKRKRDKEQLTIEFKKQLAQMETKALRAQMNPHFIFNSLNSINSLVLDRKHQIASDYLIKFSKLIRLILDNSRSELISLEKELETLKLYVLLESARFDNKFKCIYQVAEDVQTNSIMIPPMLLQPFVENAIWHGLMQKEGEGTITIEMKLSNQQAAMSSEQLAMNNKQLAISRDQLLRITITDDGIGREKAGELNSKSATHKSHGMKVTSQRIEMMNNLNATGAQVHFVDLKDELGNAMGTRVELIIPF